MNGYSIKDRENMEQENENLLKKTALGLISLLFTVELSNLAKDAQNLATLTLPVVKF